MAAGSRFWPADGACAQSDEPERQPCVEPWDLHGPVPQRGKAEVRDRLNHPGVDVGRGARGRTVADDGEVLEVGREGLGDESLGASGQWSKIE